MLSLHQKQSIVLMSVESLEADADDPDPPEADCEETEDADDRDELELLCCPHLQHRNPISRVQSDPDVNQDQSAEDRMLPAADSLQSTLLRFQTKTSFLRIHR